MRPNIADQFDFTFWYITIIAIALLIIVVVPMVYFMYKYNAKRNPTPENITGHTGIEIAWTVIPTLLVISMFMVSLPGFQNVRNPPDDSMPVKVIGQMWKWNFEYENGKKSDTLYVPLGRNIRANITSLDVGHSLFIPHYKVKEDAVAGRTNYLWFHAAELGSFDIACAEYCGLQHSYMYTKVKVVTPEFFDVWYNTLPKDSTQLGASDSLKTVQGTGNTNVGTSAMDTTKLVTPDSLKVKKDTTSVKKDTTKRTK